MIIEKLSNSFNEETLKAVQAEYNRVFEEMKEKYSDKLIRWFGEKYTKSSDNVNIVMEKIMLLTKAHFEHELGRIYNPDEKDPVLLKRQDDVILCMLYATEVFLTKHNDNRKIVK